MGLYGIDRYGTGTYGPPSEAWPYLQVFIGTSRESEALILDDPDRGILDDATLGDDIGFVWETITADVLDQGVTINRGSTRSQGPYFRYEAGTATFSLVNQDGRYDPTNTTSEYFIGGVSQLRPSLPVKVEALYRGIVYPLFIGYVDRWEVTYPGRGTTTSTVNVTCNDIVGVLAAADKPESPEQGTGDTVAARLDRIFDNVGLADDLRDFQVDTLETLQATNLARDAWTDALLAADSFNGYLYAERAGVLKYRTKSSFPRAASVRFGEGGIPIEGARITSDVEQVYNVVKLGRAESTVGAVQDDQSRALYGLRGYSRSDLICTTDEQVSQSLDYVLSQFSDLQLRVEAINVTAADTDDPSKWAALLGMEVLTRIATTINTPDGREVAVDGLVRGLTLRASRFTWDWTISTTQAPNRGGNFTLDADPEGVLAVFTNEQVQVLTSWYEWLSTESSYAPTASTLTFNDLLWLEVVFGFPTIGFSILLTLRDYLTDELGWTTQEATRFDREFGKFYRDEWTRLISSVATLPTYPELAAF